jgi:hypothetical protein
VNKRKKVAWHKHLKAARKKEAKENPSSAPAPRAGRGVTASRSRKA